jgi:phasin
MTSDPNGPFEISPEMRAMADKSFEQARQAFEKFMGAAHTTISAVEDQGKAAQAGAKDISAKIMTFAQQNFSNAFQYAQNLVHAKDPQALMQMHADFLQAQMKTLSEQAKELGEAATKAAKDAQSAIEAMRQKLS